MEQSDGSGGTQICMPWEDWVGEIERLHRQLLEDLLEVVGLSNVSMDAVKEGGLNMTPSDWSRRPDNEHSVRPLQRAYFSLWRAARMIQAGPDVPPKRLLVALRAAHEEIRSAQGRIAEEYGHEAANLQREMMADKANLRHAQHAQAQQLVEDYWWQEKEKLGFKTMQQAGHRLAEWLEKEHGLKVAGTTVSRWLSAFATAKGCPRYYQSKRHTPKERSR